MMALAKKTVQLNKGPQEAARMIGLMPPADQKRILHDIEKLDPILLKKIKQHLITLEDLRFLTPKMIYDFTREVALDRLGIAFRAVSKEVIQHITNNVSLKMKQQILEGLQGALLPVEEIQNAQQEITQMLREKVEKGSIVINRDETLV